MKYYYILLAFNGEAAIQSHLLKFAKRNQVKNFSKIYTGIYKGIPFLEDGSRNQNKQVLETALLFMLAKSHNQHCLLIRLTSGSKMLFTSLFVHIYWNANLMAVNPYALLQNEAKKIWTLALLTPL